MHQILMPINSSASSATIDRVSRFQENATVNFAIKADSLEKICKVSAFEMLTETRHRQATCHDVQSTVLSVRQKENSNSLSSPIVTRIGDKAAKCQTQRQPGVVHKPRLHNEFLKSCPESPRRVHVCGCLSGICSWIRLLCCFASIRRQFSTCIANITHIVHLAFLRVANQSQHSEITLYAFITFLSSLCFLNSLNGEFVHDDIPALVQNPDVLGITSIVELFTHDFWGRPMADIESHKSYRPITTLTFRWNMAVSVHPFGFHLVNLVLHNAVSLLVTRLARDVLHFSPRPALIAATLFATHPIHCEAVSSIVGRADVLCALFYLLAFFAFHKSLQCSSCSATQVVSLCLCVLWAGMALLCKETGLTVLGVCAFYWLATRLLPLLSRRSRDCHQVSPTALFLPIGAIGSSFAILLTLRLRILGGTLPLFSEQDNPASYSSLLTRVLTYLYLAVFNVRLLLSPSQQAYDYQTGSIHLVESLADSRNVTTSFLVFVLCAAAYRLTKSFLPFLKQESCTATSSPTKKRTITTPVATPSAGIRLDNPSHALLLSFLFLVLPYLPASHFFLTTGVVVAPRLLYLPSIGFVCLLTHGISQLSAPSTFRQTSRTAAELMLAFLALLFVTKTLQQNHVWSSRETLYRSGLASVPSNAKVHFNYANFLQDNVHFLNAKIHYETAIRLWPTHASAHNNLGALFWRLSEPEQAERHFASALLINPYHAKAHFNLAQVYSKRGQMEEAIILMERSIRLDGRFGESYEALASVYGQLGQLTIAERLYRKAIRLRPKNSDFHNNYGAFLQKTGRFEYAIRQYRRALELKPHHRIALLNMANALTSLQRFQHAENFVKRALRLKEDPVTLDSLGALFLRQSKLHLARHVYEYIWSRYFKGDITVDPPTQTSKYSTRENKKAKHSHHLVSSERLSASNIRIHYAQLLILQHRYVEAEVLLEALTRLEHGGDIAGANAEETRGRQEGRPGVGDWSCRHSSDPPSKTATVIQPSKQVPTLPWLRKEFLPVDYSQSRTIAWKNHDNQVTYSVTKSRGQQSANQRELSTKQSQYLHLAPLSASAIVTTSSKSVNQSTAFDASIWPKGRKHQPHSEPQIMNSLDTLPKNRLPQKSELRSGSRQLAASLLLIDVHHQMALLYTLTNRSDEALNSISNALTLCSSISGTLASRISANIESMTSQSSFATQNARCAQIYTLQGDINKDLRMWHEAIQSYRRAIQIDECLGRPHLNLAVIYHLKEQYTEAMLHYTYASQLDASGTHARLINENMRKLRRQRQNSSYQQQQSAFFTTQKTCQSRAKTLRAQASHTNTQSPNTTFDYEKRSSFISNSGTDETIGATSSFFSLHTASVF